jgi:KUP system potassium uptake protein
MIHGQSQRRHEKLEAFVAAIRPDWPRRSPGTSVYLAATDGVVPAALPSSLARYQTLRENVVILKLAKEDAPHVAQTHRATIHSLGKGIWQMVLHYGYMEQPDVAETFCKQMQSFPEVDLERLTFFVGRSIFVEGPHHTFRPRWRKSLFLWLANSVEEEFDYSRMPSGQLVQIGSQVEV